MTRQPPLWLATPSRWAGLSRRRARIGLAVVALAIVLSWLALLDPAPAGRPRTAHLDDQTDVALYEGIVEGVRHGGHYYQVAADALREGDYPLRPFVTFRLPTLARVEAALPPWVVLALLWTLAAGVFAAWYVRLAAALPRLPPRLVAMTLLAGGMMAFVQPGLVVFHEIWAGLLIALSLALRRPGRWVEAAAVALAAMLIRETAALYVLVMAALAWREGARREAAGWAATLGVLAVTVAFHAHAVGRVVGPLDPASPGWGGMLGVGFVARTEARSTALALFPLWFAAPLVALSLFGWASWRDPLALRVTATLVAYAVLLALFGRADTFYWGLMIAPALLVGLAFVPDALRDLAAAARDRRRITVKRMVR